jgi:hypothetical protein
VLTFAGGTDEVAWRKILDAIEKRNPNFSSQFPISPNCVFDASRQVYGVAYSEKWRVRMLYECRQFPALKGMVRVLFHLFLKGQRGPGRHLGIWTFAFSSG